jgi:hypothetical protein
MVRIMEIIVTTMINSISVRPLEAAGNFRLTINFFIKTLQFPQADHKTSIYIVKEKFQNLMVINYPAQKRQGFLLSGVGRYTPIRDKKL